MGTVRKASKQKTMQSGCSKVQPELVIAKCGNTKVPTPQAPIVVSKPISVSEVAKTGKGSGSGSGLALYHLGINSMSKEICDYAVKLSSNNLLTAKFALWNALQIVEGLIKVRKN